MHSPTLIIPSILGVLGIALVALKLHGAIDISWWWVMLPFWAAAFLAASLISFILIFDWHLRRER